MKMNEMKEKNKKELSDSWTIGTAAKDGALKVYMDMNNLEECEVKLKNFYKIKKFIEEIKGRI